MSAKRAVINIQTVIQTTFGILNEDGDVVETKVVQGIVKGLTTEAFLTSLADIKLARQKIFSEVEAETMSG